MNRDRKTRLSLALITVGFAALTIVFAREPARPGVIALPPIVPADSLAIVPGTIRISAGQLIRNGGDTSGLACYNCHDQKKPPEISFDSKHRIILPKEHADLIFSARNCAECHPPSDPVKLEYADDGTLIMPMAHAGLMAIAHGRNFRNENCYNCHDRDHLDRLHTPEGAILTFEQATLLCAGCHGPNYRDWEAGIHGRTSGYWDRSAGPITRQECTSCHDPHAPAFTGIIPMPGPHLLHPPSSHASPAGSPPL